jgi:predicted N-acetyltransferase YhbS
MIEYRSLRPEELDAWACHCEAVFKGEGHPVDKAYFLGHFHNDPWRDVNGIFVAVDGGAIASTVRVFHRKVWLLGREIPMGGIGEVSTDPAYRGRGLAGTLLSMSVEWMRREGLAVSVLYSGLHDFYRRYGWDVMPKTHARFTGVAGAPCEGRAMSPGDLPALMAVDAAAARSNWRVVRDSAEYWEKWMTRALERCVVATEGSSVVAWMAYSTADERWSVSDFRALPGFEGRFRGLCSLAAILEGRNGQEFTAPAWFAGDMQPAQTMTLDYSMVRLNIPFTAADTAINSTLELIAASGEYQDSVLDHF